jgi:magnesium transporter
MIRSYPHAEAPWSGAIWIDLCTAADDERAEVERVTGLRVPTKAAISEIETSSRVFTENGALYLSTPLPTSGDAHSPLTAAGFVLTERLLLTVRFAENPVFDGLYEGCAKTGPHSAGDVFLRILEALVDRSADTLEHASAELDALSQRAFHAEGTRARQVKKASESLRQALRKLGQMADWISQIRDTLLGLGRIAAFISETADTVLGAEGVPRLKAVRADIEQNDIVKILTIVSVVGVPPVLVAGIYGMNFKHIPEFDWSLGYPYALGLMVVTGLLPLAWFKWRGWM